MPFLMLLQAIPVLHFFAERKAVFYSYVDEEKPEQKSKAESEWQHYLAAGSVYPLEELASVLSFPLFVVKPHRSPTLESLTPPPDAGC